MPPLQNVEVFFSFGSVNGRLGKGGTMLLVTDGAFVLSGWV